MHVCPDCFGDKGLRRKLVELRARLPVANCDFHPTKKGIPIEEVAKIVDPVFRDNYFGSTGTSYFNEHGGYDFADVIYDLTVADDNRVVRKLMGELENLDHYWPPDGDEPFYSEDYTYVSDEFALGEHTRLWSSFRQSLMHTQRFFNNEARELIERIFKDVHKQRDSRRMGPVYMIKPGEKDSTFFRARLVEDERLVSEIEKNPAQHLGPPPDRLRRAGRLNAAGVLTFYGAFDLETCIAELRPPVGSLVIGGKFEIKEPICVLDTTRFGSKPKVPNLFAQHARERRAQWKFMQAFMDEISRPITPGDEHLDYLPSQAVAEYLVHQHKFALNGSSRAIDAIIYKSAQRPEGRNIALLGSCAVVRVSVEQSKFERDVDDFFPFGWTGPSARELPARIASVPNSLERHRVLGAHFTTRPVSDYVDCDDDSNTDF